MKYWASNFAIIPAERDPCLANAGMAPENEWLSPGITSWMRCGEHPRRLFLQLLFGSMFLIAGSPSGQGSGVVHKCMRAFVSVSAASLSKSNIAHQTSHIAHRTSNIEHPFPSPKSQTTAAKTGIHAFAPCHILRSESPHSFHHSFIPSFLSPNGALLARQTTSITNPSPTARNGAAARTPLPEAGERDKKMNHHFQICTKGYLAGPGIPIPASGLFIGHSGGNHRVNVERCKGVKDGQPPPFTHSHIYTFTHSSLNPEEP